VTELWFVDGTDYLGTVIIRHQLTPALERAGGHLGYHVVPGHRRRGHATQMLTQAKLICVIPRTPSSKQNKHSAAATRDRGWRCGQPGTQ
jgi:hypothetical protein